GVSESGAVAEITQSAATEALVDLAGSAFDAGSGAVTVSVSADNEATAELSQSGGGGITVTVLSSTATISAPTRAIVEAASAVSGDFSVSVDAGNTASASVELLEISIAGGNGLTAKAELPSVAQITAAVTIGPGNLAASGDVSVSATSRNTLSSDSGRVTGGLVQIDAELTSSAIINAATSASFDGSITSSTGVAIDASATNSVSAKLRSTGISLVSVQTSNTVAQVTSEAATMARFGTGSLATTGEVSVKATSSNTADVDTDTLAGGLGALGFSQPTARIDSPTTAFFAADQTGGLALKVEAESANTATIIAGLRAIGLVGAGAASPQAIISALAWTTATISEDATVNSPNAAMLVSAKSANTVMSSAGAVVGGAIAVSTSEPKASVEALTGAYLRGSVGSATLPGAASLTMFSGALDVATAFLTSSGGGVANINTARATASVSSLVETVVGAETTGSVVNVVGDVTLAAQSNPSGVSRFNTSGGGVVNVSTNEATVTLTPKLNLEVTASSILTAGGAITMTVAFNTTAPAIVDPEYVFASVNPATNRITFTAPHGLSTGTVLSYVTDGGTVGGLVNNSTYGILVVNDTTVLLGTEFNAALVDPVANTITFGQEIPDGAGGTDFIPLYHGFEDGTMVVYYSNGATVPGLIEGKTYRVKVIDDSTIQLYDPLVLNAPVFVTGVDIVDPDYVPDPDTDPVTDTVSTPHHFLDGQLVIYTAPDAAAEFSSAVVDILAGPDGLPAMDPDSPSITPQDNDTIIIPDHGFATGDEVIYGTGGGTPIGGLTPTQSYWVIVVDSNRIRLAASYCEAVGFDVDDTCFIMVYSHDEPVLDGNGDPVLDDDGNPVTIPIYVPEPILVDPISLTPDVSTDAAVDVIHKLYLPGQQPIGGLVDGGMYYVVNSVAGESFQLSETSGGSVIVLDGTDRDGIGYFTAGLADLTGVGDGVAWLAYDLTTTGSGNQALRPLTFVGSVPPGARYSSATVSSSGGGVVSVGTADTRVTVNATIVAKIDNGAQVTSGKDFTLTTRAQALGSADSSNGGAGFVAVGRSRAGATVNASTAVVVGVGASITSGWNLHIDAQTAGDVRAKSDARASGLGAGVNALARATSNLGTIIDIDGSLIAEHLLGVRADTRPNGDVWAFARARGLGADASGNDCGADCGLYITANSQIDFAGANRIQGDELEIVAVMGNGSLRAFGKTDAKAAGADSDARSRIQVRGGSSVTINPGVVLTGWQKIRMASENVGLNYNSRAEASCGCAFGDTDATAQIDHQTTSGVTAHPGVLVETFDLDVEATQTRASWSASTSASRGWFDGGSSSTPQTYTGNRPIHWEADVILHGGNPQLYVDTDGTILKRYGFVVTDGVTTYGVGDVIPDGATIVLNAIVNTGGATADFTINANPDAGGNRNLTGTLGSFQIQSTLDFVRVYNWSDRDLVVNGINPVNLHELAATVSERAYNQVNNFRYDIRPPVFVEPRIEIVNFRVAGAGNSITLAGEVYNPIGTVVVDNRNGDILSVAGIVAIIANVVELSSLNGSIGELGTRVPVAIELIESTYSTPSGTETRTISISAEAFLDLVLDITSIRRSEALTPLILSIGMLHAGRDIDIE
ncbi:MAG: hypothetical protein KF680_11795, partial [Cryobacterium sp.]|nr:hypothetical protein [Cryobacterium sp.]